MKKKTIQDLYLCDPETLERLETQAMNQADYQTQLDFERESNGDA